MKTIHRIAAWLQAFTGKRRYAMAFALGVLLTLAFPPFWLLPLAAVGITGWVWLLEAAPTGRKAFAIGWWFGFGHFISGVYWVTIALGAQQGQFLWVVPFALLLLPAYLALFPALAGLAFWKIPQRGFPRLLLLGVFWLAAEYVRSFLMTGFPWNLLGYVWTVSGASLQAASLVGVFGLSLWAILLASVFSLMNKPGHGKAVWGMVLASAFLVGWGAARLAQNPTQWHEDAPLVRIVQSNIDQDQKWDPAQQRDTLQKHLDISRAPAPHGRPDYIIWPETAMPYPFTAESQWPEILGREVPENGALITGVIRTQLLDEYGNYKVWNSLQAVSGSGELVGIYDKNILVPFGEFLPLRWIFNSLGLSKVTHGSVDFSRGEGARNLHLPGKAPIMQPLICYETIFPAYIPIDEARPDWLLNVTNDGWFGNSTGPYQHLQMARTRAVERGITLIRAANTGISAGFDAYGRKLGELSLNETGFLDIRLAEAVVAPNWHSRHGGKTLVILSALILAVALRFRRRNLLEPSRD